jgi:hypothetical protein
MFRPTARARVSLAHPPAEAWLMSFMRHLTDRLARPNLLWPDELSPHLRRDIGLDEGRTDRYRRRS